MTAEIVWRVKELAAEGVPGRRIARELELARGTIEGILHGHYDDVDWDGLEEGRKRVPRLKMRKCPLCGGSGYLVPHDGLCVACHAIRHRSEHRPDHAGLEETPTESGPLGPCLGLDLPADEASQTRYQQARQRAEARFWKGVTWAPDLHDPAPDIGADGGEDRGGG